MLPEYLKNEINDKYSVLLEDSRTCPKCGSLRAVIFYDMSDGRPCVTAVCLQCGNKGALPKYMYDKESANQLNQWRQIVLNRDDRRCHICGSDIFVQAHHIIPRDHDKEGRWWYSPTNGIALCYRCHEHVHGKWMSKYYKNRRRV